MKIILAFIFAFTALFTSIDVKADRSATAELRLIEDKFRALDPKDDEKRAALIDEATTAVAKLTDKPQKKLDRVQVKEIVELLRVMHKHDAFHRVIDENFKIFETNKKEINEELKKLSKEEAQSLREDIDIVLNGGQDTDVPEVPKSKSKKK